jgi:hypothetical protein
MLEGTFIYAFLKKHVGLFARSFYDPKYLTEPIFSEAITAGV